MSTNLTSAEALDRLEHLLRQIASGQNPTYSPYGSYGYDVYLPSLAATRGVEHNSQEHRAHTSVYADVAWALAQRGLLRPGAIRYQTGSSTQQEGMGYSLTQAGRDWLNAHPRAEVRVEDADHTRALLEKYGERFGPVFVTLAGEALQCYHAQCFLAACSVAGAAAEALARSVVEARSSQDHGGEPGSLALALSGLAPDVAEQVQTMLTALMQTGQQVTAGQVSRLDVNDAYLAIQRLVESAKWLDAHWAEGIT